MDSIDKSFQIRTKNLVLLPKGYRSSRTYPLLVALHGMGMTAKEFAEILEPLRSLPLIVLVPEGVYPFEIRLGREMAIGRAWYLYTGDDSEFVESMEKSGRHVTTLIKRTLAEYPVDNERVAMLGFSQGGYFAGYYGIRHAAYLAGLVVIGARVKDEVLPRELPRAYGLPVLLMHGKKDRAVPLRLARASHHAVQEAVGETAELRTYDCGHTVTAEQLRDARTWLKKTLGL
ncbi:MAG: dienelactone hydrolase family protein [Planctomycetota bacterium]